MNPWFAYTGYIVAIVVLALFLVGRRRRLRFARANGTENENLFLRAVEEAGHAIYIADHEGRIEYVNPAFTRVTGYTLAEVEGKTSRILKSGLMDDDYYQRLWSSLLRGETWHEDIINRAKNGRLYYASQTIAPITDPLGRPMKFVAIQTDITERRRTEQQLTAREYQYRLLAEHATDMITRHSPDGRYLYASPASRTLLGYEPDEMIGRSAYELFNPDDLPQIQDSHTQILDGERSSVVTYRILHRDGHWVWAETTSKAVMNPDSGTVEEIIAITRDVSERVAMQRRLEAASSEADRANRSKTEFLANMSHEIKTPLNAILGYSELLCRRIEDHELHSYADLIHNAGSNLLKLLNDVLDMSKIDAGKMTVHPVPSGIRAIAEDVTSMFALRAAEKGVELSLQVSDRLPRRVMLDDTRFRQILVNIVGNAAKFTDAGSVLVRIDARRNDANTVDVIVAVEDSGVGIPRDRLEAIFEPFEQADASISQLRGGTGLGLAITRRLADLLGGRLEVTSTHGRGSCFTVTLPALPVVRESDVDSRPETPRRGTITALPRSHAAAGSFGHGVGAWTLELTRMLRQRIGEETVDGWKKLFRVKMMDDLADMAAIVSDAARDLAFDQVAATAEHLQEAARRFDASTIDVLVPIMERYLYGDPQTEDEADDD